MKTVGFFNVKSRVGKTTLVYHLAWMYQELRTRTVTLDLDPQSDLTAAFVSEQELANLLTQHYKSETILRVIEPVVLRSQEEVAQPQLLRCGERLAFLPGDFDLNMFEDHFARAWSKSRDDSPEALRELRIVSSFYLAAQEAARQWGAELVLIDIGPGSGSISRAALIACDAIVIPLNTDVYLMQGIPILGSTLRRWRSAWKNRLAAHESTITANLSGSMNPIGFVILHSTARPLSDYQQWTESISDLYHRDVLGEPEPNSDPESHLLATLRYYRGLMPLAQAARKPMFLLNPADGALGSNAEAVVDCYRDFKQLATRIAAACGIDIPS